MSYDSEMAAKLAKELPSVMPRDSESGNYLLLQAVGHEGDAVIDDKDAVDRALTVQHADTVAQLEELAKLVQLNPREGESREKYRSRTIARFNLNTAEGTIEDIISGIATILDVPVERIGYEELDTEYSIEVQIPLDALENINLSRSDLGEIINDLTAASVGTYAVTRGTFQYVTPSTYQDCEDGTDSWNNYPGYDGYDETNNERKNLEDAGTYGGVLQ